MAQRASEYLHPTLQDRTPATTTPLSIADSACIRFADTGGIWVFHPSPSGAPPIHHLRSSLVSALALFPHWAGQVAFVEHRPGGIHSERCGRLQVSYGYDSDPGVGWTVVEHDFPAASIVPEAGALSRGPWNCDVFPEAKLMPGDAGLPSTRVQLNRFSCGGYAVAIKVLHVLADAQSLLLFVHEWAAQCRTECGNPSPSPFAKPIFDPAAVNARAAGNVDAAVPDAAIMDTAMALPQAWYDLWDTNAEGYLPFLVDPFQRSIAQDVPNAATLLPATAPPWTTWDIFRPVSRVVYHFSGAQLKALKKHVQSDGGNSADVSRLDVLLAQLFILITRARQHQQAPSNNVTLSLTMDMRRRLSPPLPDTNLGSPVFLSQIQEIASAVRGSTVADIASKLRRTTKAFTADAVAAYLHASAFEPTPLRLMHSFVGSHSLTVSSWQRLRLYEVDFEGTRNKPAYVHDAAALIDGLVIVMDPLVDDEGVDVMLSLDAETIPHLATEMAEAGRGSLYIVFPTILQYQ
ncbi:transferase family protein [Stachybotrys elegans]|uniref:Transferase family protein n=1 Tax=Stachybotrys elegans TaxID=80388 RepID=A0A8K0S7S3_9HYPO|nr:transferase family protein [Stachybotrys elegans]